MTYTQCGLYRKNVKKVSWIPTEFARTGKALKLKDNGIWEDGWIVEWVGQTDDRPDVNKTIRNHRKNTGDSLPKN